MLPPAPVIQVIPEEAATSPPMAIAPQVENARKRSRPSIVNIGTLNTAVAPTLSGNDFVHDPGTRIYSLTRPNRLEK